MAATLHFHLLLLTAGITLFPCARSRYAAPSQPSCQQSREDCVCLSKSLPDEFSNLFFGAGSVYLQEPNVIIHRIQQGFQCRVFVTLPRALHIQISGIMEAPGGVRRKYYRVKRNIIPNQSKLTRRVRRQDKSIHDKLEAAISNYPKNSNHHYVPLGGKVTLHCYNSEIGVQEDVFGSNRRFKWSHLSGKPITSPLTLVNEDTGDLTFEAVQLADTDIFVCTASAEDNGQHVELKRIQRQIDVVADKSLWLRFGIAYFTDSCRHKELLFIQDHLLAWVSTHVCHFCSVRNVSVNCVDLGQGDTSEDKYVQIQFALSTIGFESLVGSWDHIMCPFDCMLLAHSKLLAIMLTSLKKLFSLQIIVEVGDQTTSTYTSLPDTMENDTMTGCPPGFFSDYQLCFPCPAGKFSPNVESKCFPCSIGYFQPNLASSACVPCPTGYSTTGTGSVSQASCVTALVSDSVQWFAEMWEFLQKNWGLLLLLCGILPIICILLVIACCCRNSSVGRLLRCVPCCGTGSTEDDTTKERLIPGDQFNTNRFPSRRKKSQYPASFRFHDEETDENYDYDSRIYRKLGTEQKNPSPPAEKKFLAPPLQNPPKSANSRKQIEPSYVKDNNTPPLLPRPICGATHFHQHQRKFEGRLRNHQDISAGDSSGSDIDNHIGKKFKPAPTKRPPHLSFSTTLGKSRSLEAKLAERRRKLGVDPTTEGRDSDFYIKASPSRKVLNTGSRHFRGGDGNNFTQKYNSSKINKSTRVRKR